MYDGRNRVFKSRMQWHIAGRAGKEGYIYLEVETLNEDGPANSQRLPHQYYNFLHGVTWGGGCQWRRMEYSEKYIKQEEQERPPRTLVKRNINIITNGLTTGWRNARRPRTTALSPPSPDGYTFLEILQRGECAH